MAQFDPVALCESLAPKTASADATVLRTFPLPAQVAIANLGRMTMLNARKQAVVELAKAALANPRLFQPLGTIEETVARLRAIRGSGDWTGHYIARRAVREPDAVPAADSGLLRSVAKRRAYAVQHLWAADAAARTAEQGET